MRKILIAGVLVAAGCGSGTQDGPELINGLTLPPLEAGYTRFITPIVKDIQPGQDITYCQWLTAPQDKTLTVRNFAGVQTHFGHHIVLYSNSLTAPVGTSRECGPNDMLSVRFVGATPGEGNALDFKLPEGVVFSVPAGTSLMANVHFINTSREPVDGQGYIDLELRDPQPGEIVAGSFANVGVSFDIPAGNEVSAVASCPIQKEMEFFTWSNHMHEWGKSAYSEIVRANGTREMILEDQIWTEERVFDPLWRSWTAPQYMKVGPGDRIETHCTWMNDTGDSLQFPREMCVGFGFYVPGGPEIHCTEGSWEDE